MDIEYGKNNKKKILKLVLVCIGIIALFVYTKPVKIIKMVLEGNYQQSINNNEEKIDIGDKRNYNETIENYDEKFKKGLVNAYGQEMIVDKNNQVIDWTNKIEITDHKLQTNSDEEGLHQYYIAKLGDEKNWKIGPAGFPEPPEEFKCRPDMATVKTTNDYGVELKEYIMDSSLTLYNLYYEVNGLQYTINYLNEECGRTVFGPDGEVALLTTSGDKSTNEELIATVLAQDKFQQAFKGKIKTQVK